MVHELYFNKAIIKNNEYCKYFKYNYQKKPESKKPKNTSVRPETPSASSANSTFTPISLPRSPLLHSVSGNSISHLDSCNVLPCSLVFLLHLLAPSPFTQKQEWTFQLLLRSAPMAPTRLGINSKHLTLHDLPTPQSSCPTALFLPLRARHPGRLALPQPRHTHSLDTCCSVQDHCIIVSFLPLRFQTKCHLFKEAVPDYQTWSQQAVTLPRVPTFMLCTAHLADLLLLACSKTKAPQEQDPCLTYSPLCPWP